MKPINWFNEGKLCNMVEALPKYLATNRESHSLHLVHNDEDESKNGIIIECGLCSTRIENGDVIFFFFLGVNNVKKYGVKIVVLQ